MLLNRRQFRLMLPLGIALALSLTGDLTIYAVLANQTEVLGISLAVVGILLGVNRLIRIPGNLLAGAVNDRTGPGLGRRPLFLLGLFLGILATLSYGFVYGFWPLLAARLLWGTAWSLINVTGYTMVLDGSTPEDRGRMMGFYQMAFMLGLAISPLLGGMLTDAVGFRLAVRICAGVSAIGFVVALFAVPETRPPQAETLQGPGTVLWRQRLGMWANIWRQARRSGLLGSIRQALGLADRRILLASAIYSVTLFVGSGVMMSTIALYLGQRWGANISINGVAIGVATLAGMLLAMRAFAGMFAGPLAGTLSDRLRNRWPVVRAGILLGVAGFVTLALLLQVWAVPAGVALVALSAGALATVLAALVGDLARADQKGRTIGGLATAGDIGSTAGPFVAYALLAILDLRWIYLLCALALASTFLATVGQGGQDGTEE